jgi:hypothetical protein
MRRYLPALAAALAGIALFAAGAVTGRTMMRGDTVAVREIELPTACDNFVAASEIFAQEGASAALTAGGSDPLGSDAEQRAQEMLRSLLTSCNRELASRAD